MEQNIDVDQDRYTRNRNRLDSHYKKNDFVITHGTCFSDDSKFSYNDNRLKDNDDMTNKINCSNLNQLFIGNLTWWTTDQDIMDSIIDVGVHDFIDIHFFENQENGQSKGFCIVTLKSEKSLNRILRKLPNKLIHGRKPVVTFPSSSAYFMFESKSETRLSLPSIYQNISSKGGMSKIPVNNSLQNPSQDLSYHTRIPLMFRHIQIHNQHPQTIGYENQCNRSYQQNMRKYFVTPEQSLIEAEISLRQMNQSYHCQSRVDPTLFNQTSVPITPQSYLCDDFRPFYTHSYGFRVTNEIEMTETEIMNIINRNRIVSSSAIARAITNATNGEYISAIETLNIAIALIKDSKMANDERSKILVCTMFHIIHGIQTKMINKRKEFSRSPSDRLYRKSKRKHS